MYFISKQGMHSLNKASASGKVTLIDAYQWFTEYTAV